MSDKKTIHSAQAPEAIGTYSQAVIVSNTGKTVYLSGQIPLDLVTMQLINGDMYTQVRQVFSHLSAVCEAAGGSLAQIVKLNVYLIDLGCFSVINEVMAELFSQPYPARAAMAVAALPKNAQVEIEGVMVI